MLKNKKRPTYVKQYISKEKIFHKSYTRQLVLVYIATMTIQYGGYNLTRINDIGDLQILFHKKISLSILKYFDKYFKIFCRAKIFQITLILM